MQMRVKMQQQPAYKCEKMQIRAHFVNGPILDWRLGGKNPTAMTVNPPSCGIEAS